MMSVLPHDHVPTFQQGKAKSGVWKGRGPVLLEVVKMKIRQAERPLNVISELITAMEQACAGVCFGCLG